MLGRLARRRRREQDALFLLAFVKLFFVTSQRPKYLELARNLHRALIAEPNLFYRVAQYPDVCSARGLFLGLNLLLFPQVSERLEDQTIPTDLQGSEDYVSAGKRKEDEGLNLPDCWQDERIFILFHLVRLVWKEKSFQISVNT